MGVHPRRQWPAILHIGEAVRTNLTMERPPPNRDRPKPHGELGHGPVREGIASMDLYIRRREALQYPGVVVESGHRRDLGGNFEFVNEGRHGRKRSRRKGVCSGTASIGRPERIGRWAARILPPFPPGEPVIELSPALFLTTWASGLAAAAAAVAWWRVVGAGFGWLSAGVALLFGGIGWAVGGGWPAGLGTGAALVALLLAGRPQWSTIALLACAACFAAASIPDGGLVGTLSGAMLLGGVTTEMLLGHWFLIDPTLPRWALKRLAAVGGIGVAFDAVVIGVDADWGGGVVVWAFVVLAATTLVLMVAVWFALNEPSYPGVMAATGLSYLAILTAIGAAVSGRALLDEGTSLLGADALGTFGTIAFL